MNWVRKMDLRLLCLASSAIIISSALAAPEPPPVTLDRLTVTTEPVPLLKLPQKIQLLTARFGAAAVVDGPYIYVVGGSNSFAAPLDDVERFDTRSNTSEHFATLNTARRNHRAVICQGKLYVLGGYSEWSANRRELFECSVEVVDLASRRVDLAAAMPTGKANFGCVCLHDRIYVIGGAMTRGNSIRHTNSVEVFDVASGQWSSGIRIPTPRMTLATEVTGFVLVAGGIKGRAEVADVEMFSPREQLWRKLPPLHATANPTAAASLGHYLFLFTARELIAYDLLTKKSAAYRFDYLAAEDTTSVVCGERIYVIGGRRSRDTIGLDELFPRDIMKARPPPGRRLHPGTVDGDATDNPLADIHGGHTVEATSEIQLFELRSVHPPSAK
jgi:hypothetical protein